MSLLLITYYWWRKLIVKIQNNSTLMLTPCLASLSFTNLPFFPASRTCKSNEFDCGDSCVPQIWRCDRTIDCVDGKDEENCGRLITYLNYLVFEVWKHRK